MSYLLSAASAVLVLALFGVITAVLGFGLMELHAMHTRGMSRVRGAVRRHREQAMRRHPSGRAL